MAKKLYIGIDVGGTKISAGLVNSRGQVIARYKRKTPRGKNSGGIIPALSAAVEELLAENSLDISSISGIGLGMPGLLDKSRERILASPNMSTAGLAVVPALKRKFGVKVAAENDVNAGMLGECWLGAARECKNAIGIFPGTGVGGGIVVNGRLYTGAQGAAAEAGHMMIDPGGPVCTCGNKGCLEAIAGRWAIERDIRAAVKKGRRTVVTKLAKNGLEVIKSGVLAQALRKRDKVVTEIMRKAATCIGAACVNIRHFMDPEIIVLGGGMIEACGFFMLPIVKRVFESDRYFPKKGCKLSRSALGDDAIILGAVALVHDEDAGGAGYPHIMHAGPGRVTIADRSYSKDVYVRADSKVKRLGSRSGAEIDGTGHKVGVKELKKICKKRPDILIIGTGRSGCLRLTPAAEKFLHKQKMAFKTLPTPEAVKLYNSVSKRKAILLHLAC